VLDAAAAPRGAVPGAGGEELAPGALAGHWRVTTRIGDGGCGIVYAARHSILERPAAIKVLRAALAPAPAAVARFLREARAVNQIRHPNIVDIFDVGTLPDGRPFLVMELLAPGDLEHRVAATGRLVPAEALAILAPIGDALEAAHRAGYIHRDLKARNIGFAPGPGGVEVPKLLDFGIAKLLDAGRESGTGTLGVGTLHCMAPEQIRGGRVDARTDVYALGVLVHHLLTGRCPFEADDAPTLERLHLEAAPPPPSRWAPVPAALDALVLRALAKDPADRPASPRMVIEALAAAARGAGAAPGPARAEALAICVELVLPVDLTDADVDDAAAATDLAATLLEARGFTPDLVTATEVRARRRAGTDPASDRAAARAAAAAVERALAQQPLRSRARVAVGEAAAEDAP
jgi:serine/threonine-protein kinase